MVEEAAGLRKKRTPLDEAADMWAVCLRALRGMENMVPRPSPDMFDMNQKCLKDEEKLRRLAEAPGEDVETAKKHALEKQRVRDLEMQGFTQAMARQNPGQ